MLRPFDAGSDAVRQHGQNGWSERSGRYRMALATTIVRGQR